MCGQAIEPGGGVRMQGLMWRDGLEMLGHKVDLISFWNEYDWKSYDAIIVLQMVGQFGGIIKKLSYSNQNIIFAPIMDPGPKDTPKKYLFFSKRIRCLRHWGLNSDYTELYDNAPYAKLFLTRSNQETEFLSKGFEVDESRIKIVPLSLRFEPLEEMPQNKEDFCFHVSRLASPNKNVERIIASAKKYNFQLKLAGFLHGEEEKQWLNNQIAGANNIEYVGALSDMELKEYYRRAKVFALPSCIEGVGMVAMEAAAYGCEIVLTNLGAPKDYYNGMAELVDPFSVDDIGTAIVKCMKGKSQPQLLQYMKDEYTLYACSKKLESAISSIQ